MNNSFDDIFSEVGQKYGIDPDLLKAHAYYESGLDPSFKNPDSSASGLTAFTDDTAKDYGVDRSDPKSAIEGQAKYLKANYQKFQDSPDPVTAALSAYKTGPNAGTVDQHYVNGVMQVYKDLKGNQAPKTADTSNTASPVDAAMARLQKYASQETPSPATPAPSDAPQANESQPASDPSNIDAAMARLQKYTSAGSSQNPAVDTSPEGTYKKTLDNARGAIATGGVPASELGYAANVVSAIPGLHEAGSAIAAGLGAGQGDTFGQRYDNLEQAQQAMRQAAAEDNPGATVLGQGGAALATAPLMPAIGSPAASVGGKVASGMATGGTYGLLSGLGDGDASKSSADSFEDRLGNATQGAMYGGAFGAAVPAALETGKSAVNSIVKAATPEVDNAVNALHSIVGSPVKDLDTTEYIKGSQPTLANAAAYAGDKNAGNLAALEKTMSESSIGTRDLYNPAFSDRMEQNNAARRNAVLDLAGSTDDLTKAYNDRSAIAKNMLEDSDSAPAIWHDPNAKQADIKPVVDKIDSILQGPDRGNPAVQKTLGNIKDLLQDSKTGDLQTDPEYLYRSGIKTINQWLESNHPADELGQLAKAASPQVNAVKQALNGAINEAVPGYSNYLSAYSAASRPIDQMEVLQNLKLVNPESDASAPTLSTVNKALQKIAQQRSQPGTNPFKSLDPDQIQQIRNLQSDLERDQSAQNLLRTKGSPTSQNLQFVGKVKNALGASTAEWPKTIGSAVGSGLGGVASYMGAPLPVSMMAGSVGAGVGEKAGEMLSNRLASKGSQAAQNVSNLLLSPSDYTVYQGSKGSAGLASQANPFNAQGRVGKVFAGSNYTPAIGVGANRLLQASKSSGSENNQ